MGWIEGWEDGMGKLTTAKLGKLPPGRHGDGAGLWLQVRPGEHRSWLVQYTSPTTRRVRSMGLGPASDVTLKQARESAAKARAVVREGIDPLEARDAAKAQAAAAAGKAKATAITFSEAARAYIAANQAGWRSTVHRLQWERSLETHVEPMIGSKTVADISTEDVLGILAPLWAEKTETASRVRGRIEAVLSYSKVRGWRSGENPAVWRGHLALTLPPKSRTRPVVHHPALDWRALPAFMALLRAGRKSARVCWNSPS
jgi:hypothetical protein